jgi:sterol desaturase/sphingolipid hydroxylase (fatty acid hydroxylase superfamily)
LRVLFRLLLAGFLLAHAAIHAGFVSKRPPAKPGAPPWPFDLGRSWLLVRLAAPAGVARLLGLALVAATIGSFALGALATLGILPAGAWGATVTAGSIASLALLLIGFHPWLVAGVAIDLLLLWVAVVAAWTPDLLA